MIKIVLWELHSASDMTARCALQHEPSTDHLITVTVGDTERFIEQYRTEAAAHDEAAHLHAYYVTRGWNETIYRDSRLD